LHHAFDEDAASLAIGNPSAAKMLAIIRRRPALALAVILARLIAMPFRSRSRRAALSLAARGPALRVAPAMAMGGAALALRHRLGLARDALRVGSGGARRPSIGGSAIHGPPLGIAERALAA